MRQPVSITLAQYALVSAPLTLEPMNPRSADAIPFDAARAPARVPVAAWLLVCCALVFAMVVVGGVTRLTPDFPSSSGNP